MEHNIVISEDQNTVTVDGRVFIAEENNSKSCRGCEIRVSFNGICKNIPCTTISLGKLVRRVDCKEVIFKEQLKTE